MAKIILEFEGAEEQQDARTAMDGYKWKLAMWDLDQDLRGVVKYGASRILPGSEASQAEIESAEQVRTLIREILDGYGLTLTQ